MADILLAKNLGRADLVPGASFLRCSKPSGEFKPKERDLLMSKVDFKVVHFKLGDEVSLT